MGTTQLAALRLAPSCPVPLSQATGTLPQANVSSLVADLARRPARPPIGNAVAIISDSIHAQDTLYTSGLTRGKLDKGIWHQTAMKLGQRARLAALSGHGGFTAVQLLPYVASDIIPSGAATCIVQAGINDWGGGSTAAAIWTALLDLCNALLDAGIRPVLWTLPPNGNCDTTGERIRWLEANRRIREGCYANGNIVLCDAAKSTTYATNTYPTPITLLSTPAAPAYVNPVDGVHPGAFGAHLYSEAEYAALSPFLPAIEVLPSFGSGTNNTDNLLANGVMSGTSGSNLNGQSTGNVAASWILSVASPATATASKIARTDVWSADWQQIAYAGGSSSTSWQLFQTVTPSPALSTSDQVYFAVEFQSDDNWVGTIAFESWLDFRDSGGNVLHSEYAMLHDTGSNLAARWASGVMMSDAYAVPSGTISLRLWIKWRGTSSTIRVGRCGAFKVLS